MPTATRLSLTQRRELFRLLIQHQDAGDSVEQSRRTVAGMFNVEESYVVKVEEQGIAGDWPPL